MQPLVAPRFPFRYPLSPLGRKIFLAVALGSLALMASAQTFKVLHSFQYGREGVHPGNPLVRGSDGRMYGTTLDGGAANNGTVFAMNADGTGYVTLKHFNAAGTDGRMPRASVIQGSDGRLYGTTSSSDTSWGTIFALNTDGTGFTVLRALSGNDGVAPYAPLMQGSDGRLYGTTWSGGTGTRGTIFAIGPDGSGFTVLRQLNSGVDGGRPMAGLIEGSDGRLYGTTSEYGMGNTGAGTIFALNRDGSNFTVLHQMVAATDGDSPRAALLEASDGRLYGTAWQGGTANSGAIFGLALDGSDFAVLHHFLSDGSLGAMCASQPVEGSDGRLYGTTDGGGGGSNAGMVFAINKNGSGYANIHSFDNNGANDGARSGVGLVKGNDGRFYGVNSAGGHNSYGTIYALNENGAGFSVLKHMNVFGDGRNPQGRTLLGSDGRLYGVARESDNGGTGGNGFSHGTIYKINRDGTDFVVLHEFPFGDGSAQDGATPNGDLIEGSDGRLYGTTQAGGAGAGGGTVFVLNRDGTGFTVIKSGFAANLINTPYGGVIQGSDGKLYGTASSGGPSGSVGGGIFSLNTDGTDYTILREFSSTMDGGAPQAALLQGLDGRLYGTTRTGGTNGGGTIFAMTKDGSAFTVLRHLASATDGSSPYGSLIQGPDGSLFGTTSAGGTGSATGTVFSIRTDGANFQVLRAFSGTGLNLRNTIGGVAFGVDGRLYGSTSLGASQSVGGIFSTNTDGTGYIVMHERESINDGTGSNPFFDLSGGSDGVVYGTANAGGSFGQGTLFAVGFEPVIVSPLIAGGTYGQSLSYTITANRNPDTFDALNLPPGLTVNFNTGEISGVPTQAGSYTVTITATNFFGTGTETLAFSIAKANAGVSLSNLDQKYSGTPKSATVTTTPSGLAAMVTYDGSAIQPINAGSHAVVATIDDNNYQGIVSGTLEIAKAVPVISWLSPAAIIYGTPLSSTQLNAVANIAGVFVYTPVSGTILNLGVHVLDTLFIPSDATNYTDGSAQASLQVKIDDRIPAGFDVGGYLARYPEVAAIYGGDPYGAWLFYRDHGIYLGEVFDELFRVEEYLALYPELFAIFGDNLGAALEHWLTTGRIEGKLGRIPLEFSATGYFTRNPDVAMAVGNDPILAWGHYWLYGIYEGRAYDEELRVFEYLAINADLTAAFVSDWRTAALHWMRYGRTEGRLGRLPLTFNVTEYLVRNPDVATTWGTNPTTVFLHFWLYGIDESRSYDDLFRPDEYLALNLDLATALGTDRRLAFKHWVRYGQTEGRPGKNP